MAGHSKWATTKHKKAALDAKRGKLFAKLVKNVEVAARLGGGDPAGNPTLYDAIQKAKKSSVPNDNIDRAVKRGSGEGADAVNYETLWYEAMAPGGVGVLIECLTDNRNRSAADVKVAVTRNGGSMADAGSVSRIYQRRGIVEVAKDQGDRQVTEDNLVEATLEAGADEVIDEGEGFTIICEPNDVVEVRKAIQAVGLDYEAAEVRMVPDYDSPVDEGTSEKLERIIDALEDLEDVQNVYHNAQY